MPIIISLRRWLFSNFFFLFFFFFFFFFLRGRVGRKPVHKCCSFLHCMWQITVNKNKNAEFVTPISPRKANIVYNLGLSGCNRVNV